MRLAGIFAKRVVRLPIAGLTHVATRGKEVGEMGQARGLCGPKDDRGKKPVAAQPPPQPSRAQRAIILPREYARRGGRKGGRQYQPPGDLANGLNRTMVVSIARSHRRRSWQTP